MEYDPKFILKLYKFQKEWKIREKTRSRNLRIKLAESNKTIVGKKVLNGLERFINNKNNKVIMNKKAISFFGFIILLVIVLMVLFYVAPAGTEKGANTLLGWLKLGSSKIGSLIPK